MLRLEDRLRVAMSAGMGCKLEPDEVKLIAGWLVTLQPIKSKPDARGNHMLAFRALNNPLVRQ